MNILEWCYVYPMVLTTVWTQSPTRLKSIAQGNLDGFDELSKIRQLLFRMISMLPCGGWKEPSVEERYLFEGCYCNNPGEK